MKKEIKKGVCPECKNIMKRFREIYTCSKCKIEIEYKKNKIK